MKKSERETLKKAFNIPEPERKESFVSLYNQKLKKNERKFNLPVFFRYASTAVFAVLIIGLWGNLSKNADFRDKFNNIDEPTTGTVQTTTVTQLTEENDITTAETMTSQIVQTIANSPAVTVHTAQTAVIEENSPQTHAQVTMPDIPDFTPSVTAITFLTKTQQPVTTAKAVSATTVIKTTAVKYTTTAIILTDEEPSYSYAPSLAITTSKTVSVTATPGNSPVPPDYIENDVTTTYSHSVDIPPPAIVTEPIVTTRINDSPSYIDGKDYTVYPSKIYNKSDNIINLSDRLGCNSAAPNDSVPSVDMLKNSSDYIILGKVDDIIYTQVNGEPYTQENITIYQVYNGDKFREYDKISVYIPGGYMPVSEFENLNNTEISASDNDYIYSDGGNKNHQTIGDIRIFFITYGSSYMPNGAFELTMKTDISIFQARGSEYISLGDYNLRFNIENLLNL